MTHDGPFGPPATGPRHDAARRSAQAFHTASPGRGALHALIRLLAVAAHGRPREPAASRTVVQVIDGRHAVAADRAGRRGVWWGRRHAGSPRVASSSSRARRRVQLSASQRVAPSGFHVSHEQRQ